MRILDQILRVVDYIASKRRIILGVAFLIVFSGETLIVVYKTGFEAGLRTSVGTQQTLDADRVQFDVEALSLIRAQDVDGAVRFLKRDLDATTVALPGAKPFPDLPGDVRRSLVMAKAYHGVFLPEGRYAARVREILSDVQSSVESYDHFGNGLGRLVDDRVQTAR